MTKNKTKSQAETVQEINLKSPHYNVFISAQSYSNIAGVLAGFAFAAVILTVQTPPSPEFITYRDWATIAFLLSFVGCVFSAFVFAMVSGEDNLYARSYATALLGGTGFSVSSNLIFFGLAMLIRSFLSSTVYIFLARGILPIIMFFSILYVAASALDPILTFDSAPIKGRGLMQLFIPSLAPLIIAWLISILGGGFSHNTAVSVFNPAMYGALAIILFSAVGSLIITSFAKVKFRFSLFVSGIMVGIHSLVIGILLLML